MKILLTPWEITETSLSFPTAKRKRRRKRNGSGSGRDDCEIQTFPNLAASFINLSSSQLKKKSFNNKQARLLPSSHVVEDNFQPTLILTLDHRISVFGTERDTIASSNKKTSSTSTTGLYESSVLQHMSRPGPSTAFCSEDCCRIPSLLDRSTLHRNSGCRRGYVFTERNQRLVSWSSSCNDSYSERSASVKLKQPAVSMALLNQPNKSTLLYGSCQDGSVYFARLISSTSISQNQDKSDQEEESWVVEYLDPPPSPPQEQQESFGDHLATSVIINDRHSSGIATPGSNKRKAVATTRAVHHSINIYQVFWNGADVIVVRRQVNLAPSQDEKRIMDTGTGRRFEQSAKIPLSQSELNDKSTTSTISNVQCLGVVQEDCSIAVSFCLDAIADADHNQLNANEKRNQYYYACISLERAKVCRAPVLVDECSGTVECGLVHQFGLVGSTLVAATNSTKDEILLYDRVRGGLLHRQSVKELLGDKQDSSMMTLVTDVKHARIAILFSRNDKVCVARSSLDTDISVRNRLSLAAGLSAATGASIPRTVEGGARRSVYLEAKIESENDKRLGRAKGLLETALKEILRGSNKSRKKSFLTGVYDASVSSLTYEPERSGDVADNPQDSVPSSRGDKINGIHHSIKKSERINGDSKPLLVNGQHVSPRHPTLPPRSLPPRSLPQAFVDSAIGTVLGILHLPTAIVSEDVRNDARLLLRRLIRSEKVSARNQLHPAAFAEVLRSLEGSRINKTSYSPIDFSFDLYRFCRDVSEHQMVSMVHYLLSRASAHDLSVHLRRSNLSRLPDSVTSLVNAFTRLEGKTSRSDKDESALAKVSSKLVVSGTTALLQTITSYSDCNESLLAAAVGKVLSRSEMILLYRMLADVLTSPHHFVSSTASGRRRLMQWISALNQVLRGPLSKAESADFSYMCRAVNDEVIKTERMLDLQEIVNDSLAAIKAGSKRSAKEKQAVSAKEKSGQLPPYQIERLVF